MATKSFLTSEELQEAGFHLKPPATSPNGDEGRGIVSGGRAFSEWVGERLLGRLSRHPEWCKCEPVILGSWARGELSPKSDIDLLFLGPESSVQALVGDFSREGLKLRYRVPVDIENWTLGVEPFDVVALFSAHALQPSVESKLTSQLERLLPAYRRNLIKAMRLERRARALRYDSIANYLEPNLKYGPGGLRDLEQALVTRKLFRERFIGADHAFMVLEYYKSFFLLVRHWLHLAPGGGDVLAAMEQKSVAEWFGFTDVRDFMREIQKGVARVSFYADWVIAQASASVSTIKLVAAAKVDSVNTLFSVLEEGNKKVPSILWQNRVRLASDEVFRRLGQDEFESGHLIGRHLTRVLDPMRDETAMLAVFHSRLIDHCLPEFRRINGFVQHDQYHRFTVDAHLLQVLRELKRFCQKPSRGGKLAPFVKALSSGEREILAMACLFHDLAKGRSGDHSLKGAEIARRELRRFGKSEKFIEIVAWIIESHLILSAAAFRENPRSPRTWRLLAEKGVKGERIRLLTVFTVVDILGTNPEAWTSWKERLLYELAHQLEQPETDSLVGVAELLEAAKVKNVTELIDNLDVFLMGSISPRVLAEDLRQLLKKQGKSGDLLGADIGVRVLRVRRGGRQTWVRFHCRNDRPGLFLSFVKWLAGSGLSVRHASIHTDKRLGVYDWFEVKTLKRASEILRLLKAAAGSQGDKSYRVRFDAIEIVSEDSREWVISFRGRDQSGALTEAARALFSAGVEIRWAKVHTWGRQLDDVFGIAPLVAHMQTPKNLLTVLREKLL